MPDPPALHLHSWLLLVLCKCAPPNQTLSSLRERPRASSALPPQNRSMVAATTLLVQNWALYENLQHGILRHKVKKQKLSALLPLFYIALNSTVHSFIQKILLPTYYVLLVTVLNKVVNKTDKLPVVPMHHLRRQAVHKHLCQVVITTIKKKHLPILT